MHILLVDDAKDTRDLYRLVFDLAGFCTSVAEDGTQAVQAVKEATKPFDVIVLDVEMPLMNGWQALSLIRQMPQGQQVPVVMWTAYGDSSGNADSELAIRAAQAGANRLIHKPMLPSKLVRVLREVVEHPHS